MPRYLEETSVKREAVAEIAYGEAAEQAIGELSIDGERR